MKNVMNRKKITGLFALFCIAILSGCGSSNGNGGVGNINGGVGVFGNGACVPINQPIPFQGQNIYIDWANIVGGHIPNSNQSVGTMTTGSQGLVGGGFGQQNFYRSGVDGTIQMSAAAQNQGAPVPYPTYPQGTFNPFQSGVGTQTQFANVSGTLQISAATMSDINFHFGGFSNGFFQNPGVPGFQNPQGFPNQQQNGVCVSGIAINASRYHETIYGGQVYLYLNNSQYGYVLYF